MASQSKKDISLESEKKPQQYEDNNEIILELPPPPDGGYGWVIMTASFIVHMVTVGVSYTFGIFLHEFVKVFNEPQSKIALAGSLLAGGCDFMGPLAGGFTNLYGCRAVVIVGVILSAGFFALSVLSVNADTLILCYALTGFSTGFIFLPATTTVSYYFENKRAFATCIVTSGSSIGGIVAGPLSYFLLNKFGWKGAHLVFAGLYLSCAVCGILMKPLKAIAVPKEEKPELFNQVSERRGSCTSYASGIFLDPVIPYETPWLHLNSDYLTVPVAAVDQRRNSHISEVSFISRHCSTIPEEEDEEASAESQNDNRELNSYIEKQSQTIDGSEMMRPKEANEGTQRNDIKEDIDSKSTSTIKKRSHSAPSACGSSQEIDKRRKSEPASFKSQNFMNDERIENKMIPVVQEQHTRPSISVFSVQRRQSCFKLSPMQKSLCVSLADNSRVQKSLSHGSIVSPLGRKDSFFQGSITKLKKEHFEQSEVPYRQRVLSVNPLVNVDVVNDTGVEKEYTGTCSRFCHESFSNILTQMLDFSLMKDMSFVLFSIGTMFVAMGYYIPSFFITDAAHDQGVDASSAALLVSIIATSRTTGRVVTGIISALPCVETSAILVGSQFLCGVSIFCIGLMSEFVGFACCAVLVGFFGATITTLISVVLVSLLGLDKLTNAYGLITLFRGAATMVGSPLAGAVHDVSGSYMVPFFFSGSLLMVGSAFSYISLVIQKRRRKKQVNKQVV